MAPCDTTSGWIRSRRSSRTHRTALPFGPHSHLCPLPVQYAAPSASTSTGTIPGAWAASTSVSMPRRSSSATSSATGKMSAVDARDVADHDQPRPRRDRAEDRVADDVRTRDREGDRRHDHPRAVAGRHGAHRVDRRVVLVIVGQELVARLEAERLEDGVVAGRGIGHEGEALGIRAEEPADRRPRVVEQPGQVARQEPDRFRFEPLAERRLEREDRFRAGPERAVVEERDARVESPAEVGPHGRARPGVVNRSPGRSTTGVPPRSASQRTSPSPTTCHVTGSAVGSRVIAAVRSASAEQAESGRRPRPEPADRRRPRRLRRVRDDDEPRHDPETVDPSARRPRPRREGHGPGAGAREDRARVVGVRDGEPTRRFRGGS